MAKWWSARRLLELALRTLPVYGGGAACSDAEEPVRVALPVLAASNGMAPIQTNLGYEVEIAEARVAIADLSFAIAGEAHAASLWQKLCELTVPPAHAHPGHYQGGEITGELPGHFLLSWLPSSTLPLGKANLIVGRYQSANFIFSQGIASDGLAVGDALLGHTAVLGGTASLDGRAYPFEAVLDAPPGRELVGAPFEVEVGTAGSAKLVVELLLVDPVEGDTLLDDIDFAALPEGSGGVVSFTPASTEPALVDAYNAVRRAFQTHDHFRVRAEAGR